MITENTTTNQTASSASPSPTCYPSLSEQLEKSIRHAYAETLETLNFEKIAKFAGKPAAELETTARKQLGQMLSRFPNVTASMGHGWHIALIRTGWGSHRVEMSYQITSGTGLIFDLDKIGEAAKHGLIDENGEPVEDPPCCPTCLRDNA